MENSAQVQLVDQLAELLVAWICPHCTTKNQTRVPIGRHDLTGRCGHCHRCSELLGLDKLAALSQADLDVLLTNSPAAQLRRWTGRTSQGAIDLASRINPLSSSHNAASTPEPSAVAQVNQDLAAARLQTKVEKHQADATRKWHKARTPDRLPHQRSIRTTTRSAQRPSDTTPTLAPRAQKPLTEHIKACSKHKTCQYRVDLCPCDQFKPHSGIPRRTTRLNGRTRRLANRSARRHGGRPGLGRYRDTPTGTLVNHKPRRHK